MAEEKKGFVVRDRRIFSTEEDDAKSRSKEARDGKVEKPGDEEQKASPGRQGPSPLPKIDFSAFILSLNSSAMVHLGIVEDPVTGAKNKNLDLARQTIDIIGMLEEKTRGNLNRDEEAMIKNLLYDLRILFVKHSE